MNLTVGLEIHAELSTKTKMFCRCANNPHDAIENSNICPVCTAQPGSLPVANIEAIKSVLKVGKAVHGTPADYTEFDRKNYFYPDLPKGYQISQYEFPLVSGGSLLDVGITRIHLEEDTARSQHDEVSGSTIVDFNRAGVPLMELVTEPDIHSSEHAGSFARELQLLLRYLGVSEANMEKGEMRVEANISVSGSESLGTKVEVKNLNSFRSVERAIEFEFKRQEEILNGGGVVIQETRGWDEARQITYSQRIKEGSADYRYFPEPDLPKMFVSKEELIISEDETETPENNRKWLVKIGIAPKDAETIARNMVLLKYFKDVVGNRSGECEFVKTAGNYIVGDLVSNIRDISTRDSKNQEELLPNPRYFEQLIDMILSDQLSSRGAKETLAVLIMEENPPKQIAEKRGFLQIRDESAIISVVKEAISSNPDVVASYKAGKEKSLQFLVGQVMKLSGGAASPKIIIDVIKRELGA